MSQRILVANYYYSRFRLICDTVVDFDRFALKNILKLYVINFIETINCLILRFSVDIQHLIPNLFDTFLGGINLMQGYWLWFVTRNHHLSHYLGRPWPNRYSSCSTNAYKLDAYAGARGFDPELRQCMSVCVQGAKSLRINGGL